MKAVQNGFPLFQKLIREETLKKGHFALEIDETNPWLYLIEYFLSYKEKNIEGFDGKYKDFLNNPINNRRKNTGKVQWISIIAELEAIALLGHHLGLQIVGFDQLSPRKFESALN